LEKKRGNLTTEQGPVQNGDDNGETYEINDINEKKRPKQGLKSIGHPESPLIEKISSPDTTNYKTDEGSSTEIDSGNSNDGAKEDKPLNEIDEILRSGEKIQIWQSEPEDENEKERHEPGSKTKNPSESPPLGNNVTPGTTNHETIEESPAEIESEKSNGLKESEKTVERNNNSTEGNEFEEKEHKDPTIPIKTKPIAPNGRENGGLYSSKPSQKGKNSKKKDSPSKPKKRKIRGGPKKKELPVKTIREQPPSGDKFPPQDVKQIIEVIRLPERPHAGSIKKKSPPKSIKSNKKTVAKVPSMRIQKPIIELDLDDEEVFLIIPKQRLMPINPCDMGKYQISVVINKKQLDVNLNVKKFNTEGMIETDEWKYLLGSPLKSFSIEIGSKKFVFDYKDVYFYLFMANKNRCSMVYNATRFPFIPRRYFLLLKEGWECKTPYDQTFDVWIWESYRPFLIDMAKHRELTIRNKKTGFEKTYKVKQGFRLRGDGLLKDDLQFSSPIFTGGKIILEPIEQSLSHQTVWIQQESEKKSYPWDPNSGFFEIPLSQFSHPFGEFQVDVCEKGSNFINETLFFSWIPGLKVLKTEFVEVPDWKRGYSTIDVKIELPKSLTLICELEKTIITKPDCNLHIVQVPPKIENLEFEVAHISTPGKKIFVSISLHKIWWRVGDEEWANKCIFLNREGLSHSKPLPFEVRINDPFGSYRIKAILKDDTKEFQEVQLSFKKKDRIYWNNLNHFYGYFKEQKQDLILELRIEKEKHKMEIPLRIIVVKGKYRIESTIDPTFLKKRFERIPLFRLYTALSILAVQIPKVQELLRNFDLNEPERIEAQEFALKGLYCLEKILDEVEFINPKNSLYISLKSLVYHYKSKYHKIFSVVGERDAIRST